ncbi:acyltransferase family protein [Georgenia sp. SYP-B2076]|uniref:acyltransferase family protein n=1 Tax=Georgenia sp. SYP-B2076 TaxID=2495881 RepID=UPI000F8D44A3|nr:acyltransferase family protein [Georgenia sp. SYP-B2076]
MTTQALQERAPRARPAGEDGRIEGLDGLRALAVAAVLVYHLRPASLPGGFLGVDIFFVVSGFLITTLLLRELRTKHRVDLPRFWLRRARRLLPALVGVVLVSIPSAWAVNTDLLVSIGRQALGALTFSSNWLEIAAGSSYFTATAPQLFVNFWSLAVEEQFYLLWPILLVALVAATSSARQRVRLALGAAAASAGLMAVLHTPGQDATRVYYGTDTHAFGLLLGVALAFAWAAPGGVLRSRGWRRWRARTALVALAGLAALMLTLRQSSAFTFRGGILLASVLAIVLVAALLGPPGPFQRLMRLAPLEWVGQRSYGIYLWHWPVLVILAELLPTAHDSPAHWALRGLALALTLAIAAASYRLLEQPVRSHGFRGAWRAFRASLRSAVPLRRVLARTVAGGTGVAVVAALVAVAVAPERTQTQKQIEAAQRAVDASAAQAGRVELPADADFTMPTGAEITGFGDSIVVTSADGLEARFPGIMLDARSIRRWSDGEAAVEGRLEEGTVRRAVFLDFGTNAGVRDKALVRRVLDSLGPRRMVVVVNLYGGSYWIPQANTALDAVVEDYPNAIVADWHSAVSERPELLQADGIHPGIEGAHLYARVVAEAFAELSERLTGVPVQLPGETADDPASGTATNAPTDGSVPADGSVPTDGRAAGRMTIPQAGPRPTTPRTRPQTAVPCGNPSPPGARTDDPARHPRSVHAPSRTVGRCETHATAR